MESSKKGYVQLRNEEVEKDTAVKVACEFDCIVHMSRSTIKQPADIADRFDRSVVHELRNIISAKVQIWHSHSKSKYSDLEAVDLDQISSAFDCWVFRDFIIIPCIGSETAFMSTQREKQAIAIIYRLREANFLYFERKIRAAAFKDILEQYRATFHSIGEAETFARFIDISAWPEELTAVYGNLLQTVNLTVSSVHTPETLSQF